MLTSDMLRRVAERFDNWVDDAPADPNAVRDAFRMLAALMDREEARQKKVKLPNKVRQAILARTTSTRRLDDDDADIRPDNMGFKSPV